MKQVFSLAFIILLLSSCSTMNFITIDVLKPAEAPLNFKGGNLVLADNSETKDSDNTSTVLLNALSQFLNENELFDQVSVYPQHVDGKIKNEHLNKIKKETKADKIIFLTRYDISSSEKTTNSVAGGTSITSDTLWVHVFANFTLYDNLKNETIALRDSLFWNQISANDVLFSAPFPEIPDILNETAVYTASKMEKKLIPHWESELRWYYTSSSTRMREAAVAVDGHNWDKALAVWNYLYSTENNKTQKAKLASNMALAYEMKDNLDEALYWIGLAEEYFPDDDKSDNKSDISNKKRAKLYGLYLHQRIIDNKKLEE